MCHPDIRDRSRFFVQVGHKFFFHHITSSSDLPKLSTTIEEWYFVTKIVLTYCEKKLGFRNLQEKLENDR